MSGTWSYDDLLNEAKSAGAWPEDWYPVQIIAADASTTSTGKDALKLNVRVLNGAYMGKSIERTLSIQPEHPNLLRQFFDIVRGFGITDEWLRQLGTQGLGPLASALPGRIGEVKLIQRPFNDRMSNDIVNARPAAANAAGAVPVGVPTPAPMTAPPAAAAPAPVAAPPAAPPVAPPAAPPVAQPAPVQFQQPPAAVPPPPVPVQAPAPVPGQATQEAAAHVATADEQWAQFQAFQAMQAAAQAAPAPSSATPAPAAAVAPAQVTPPPPPPPAPPGMPV